MGDRAAAEAAGESATATHLNAAEADGAAMADLADATADPPPPPWKNDSDACAAVTRGGAPCRNRARGRHPDLPEHGPLCGVHQRAALRQVECAICMAPVRGATLKRLECGHAFHRRCVRKWFLRGSLTCPMCRAVCFDELACSHPRLSVRMRHMVRMAPRPRGVHFVTYMLGMLNSDDVRGRISVTPDEHQLLVELAFQSFTEHNFLQHLGMMGM